MKTKPLAAGNSPLTLITATLRAPRLAAVLLGSLLALLGLMSLGGSAALAQSDCIFSACSTSSGSLLPPFWWILDGGTPYSKADSGSSCVWYHNASSMAIGEGWGVVDTCGTAPGDGSSVVYGVYVTQPSFPTLSADIIFGVASSNCDIGGVYGATAAGGWTNTTAFQPAHVNNQWGFVCWLTNRVGVTQPEIEFHYLSGTDGRTYIDSVRFLQLALPCTSRPVITSAGLADGQCSISGTGSVGKTFVLLQSTNPGDANSWTPVQTNTAGVGAFGFAADSSAAPSMFFRVQAQ